MGTAFLLVALAGCHPLAVKVGAASGPNSCGGGENTMDLGRAAIEVTNTSLDTVATVTAIEVAEGGWVTPGVGWHGGSGALEALLAPGESRDHELVVEIDCDGDQPATGTGWFTGGVILSYAWCAESAVEVEEFGSCDLSVETRAITALFDVLVEP